MHDRPLIHLLFKIPLKQLVGRNVKKQTHRFYIFIFDGSGLIVNHFAILKRNDQMVNICDCILAFWDGTSKGTKHTIDYAKKMNKPIKIVTLND